MHTDPGWLSWVMGGHKGIMGTHVAPLGPPTTHMGHTTIAMPLQALCYNPKVVGKVLQYEG